MANPFQPSPMAQLAMGWVKGLLACRRLGIEGVGYLSVDIYRSY